MDTIGSLGLRRVYNPFLTAIKADDFSEEEIRKFFVPEASAAWSPAQEEVSQIIVGSRGAGKTILLRRLAQQDGSRIGVYIQLSRIAKLFDVLFDTIDLRDQQDLALAHRYQQVFDEYLCIELLATLAQATDRSLVGLGNRRLSSVEVQQLAGPSIEAGSVDELQAFCRRRQEEIESSFARWQIEGDCQWAVRFSLTATAERMTDAARKIVAASSGRSQPAVFFLLDDSSGIRRECQAVVNLLLQRGRPYKTKLATRPYDWQILDLAGGGRLENGDYRLLPIQYPEETTEEFVSQMRKIADAILRARVLQPKPPAGWPALEKLEIADLFEDRLAGFRKLCLFSSGNPENLLTACSAAFTFAAKKAQFGTLTEITGPDVKYALFQCSRYLARAEPAIDALCRKLFDRMRQRRLYTTTIRITGDDTNPLFPTVPHDVGELLKPGFNTGILGLCSDAAFDLVEVPTEFKINRFVFPRHSIRLETAGTRPHEVDSKFVRQFCKERSGGSAADPTPISIEQRLSGFLSTSFSDYRAEERKAINEALRRVNVDCVDVKNVKGEQFLYTAIAKKIGTTDFTLLSATVPRPYTLFETGLCAGLDKPVVCVFNDEGQAEAIQRVPEFLKFLPIVTFNVDKQSLSGLASKVRTEAVHLLDNAHESEFRKVKSTQMPLRPRRHTGIIYLSFPDLPVWHRALPVLRTRLERQGLQVITEKDAETYGANPLQVPIFCASYSGFAVVETASHSDTDLLQSYKLGVCVSMMPKLRLLHVEWQMAESSKVFDCRAVERTPWKECDALVALVEEFVASGLKGRRRP